MKRPRLERRAFPTLRALLFLAPLVACSSAEKPRGELMIAVGTDMSIPDNLDQVEVLVSMPDGTQQRLDYPILPTSPDPIGKPMPGTLALVPPDAGGQTVRVRLIAQQNSSSGDPVSRVVREAIVKVPTDRVALLPMRLHWLCDGIVKKDADGTYLSDCDKDQTCVAGKCVDAAVEVEKLPIYDPGLVFGGGDDQGNGGTCIDVPACFASSKLAVPSADCTLPLPKSVDPTSFNVAIELSADSDGQCTKGADSRCFVPLDNDPDDGFQIEGDLVQLPPKVCEKIADGKALGVATTTACPTKNPSEPICGAWTNVTTSSMSDTGSGGAPSSSGSTGTGAASSVGEGGSSTGSSGKAGAGSATAGAPSSGGANGTAGASSGSTAGAGGKAAGFGGAAGVGAASNGGSAPGTGGTSTGAAGAGGSCGVCQPISGPANVLPIDDLTDGNELLLAVGQRTGVWYAVNDKTTGVQTPSPTGQWFPSPQNCHGGTGFCAQSVGSGFTAWGSQTGFTFTDCGCPYDGSAYNGITFWARSTVALRANVMIASLSASAEGGTCVPSGPLMCDDQYGMAVPQSAVWTQYTMTFGTLQQEAWAPGTYVTAPFDATQLEGMTFTAAANVSFNYAIDDVSFF